MRVYFYDRESGVYQGEGFETNSHAISEEGVTVTAPPAYGPGLVPVFDRQTGGWTVRHYHHDGAGASSRLAIHGSVLPDPYE